MVPTVSTPSPCTTRARLLVVEDELPTVFALRSFFALAGYEVDCAAGAGDGLLLLEKNAYDAVITDLHLSPGRRSEGMWIAARARQRNPRACVVMLTAYGSETSEEDAARTGVNVYQTKPVELLRLMNDIEQVLRGETAGPAS
jgi:DNA-binding response OmpR family regulator